MSNHYRGWRLLLLHVLCLSVLTGCWDFHELPERVFVVGIGIDRVDDRWRISMQTVVPRHLRGAGPGGGGGGQGQPYEVLEAEADSIGRALDSIRTTSYREIDYGHQLVWVIGAAAAAVPETWTDFISRSRRFPETAFVLVTSGLAGSIIRGHTREEELPIMYYSHAFSARYTRINVALPMPVWVLTRRLLWSPYEDMYAPVGAVDPDVGLVLGGVAVWSEAKLAGWLTLEQSEDFARLKQERFNDYLVNKPEAAGGETSFRALRGQSRLSATCIDGDVALAVHVNVAGELSTVSGKPVADIVDLKQMEQRLAEGLQGKIDDLITTLQGWQSDALGFGEKLRRREPDCPALASTQQWRETFAEAAVEVKVKLRIEGIGVQY